MLSRGPESRKALQLSMTQPSSLFDTSSMAEKTEASWGLCASTRTRRALVKCQDTPAPRPVQVRTQRCLGATRPVQQPGRPAAARQAPPPCLQQCPSAGTLLAGPVGFSAAADGARWCPLDTVGVSSLTSFAYRAGCTVWNSPIDSDFLHLSHCLTQIRRLRGLPSRRSRTLCP